MQVLLGASPAPLKLASVARECWGARGSTSSTPGNSWVRNSLRRLHGCGLVEQVGRGEYRAALTVREIPVGLGPLLSWFDSTHPKEETKP